MTHAHEVTKKDAGDEAGRVRLVLNPMKPGPWRDLNHENHQGSEGTSLPELMESIATCLGLDHVAKTHGLCLASSLDRMEKDGSMLRLSPLGIWSIKCLPGKENKLGVSKMFFQKAGDTSLESLTPELRIVCLVHNEEH